MKRNDPHIEINDGFAMQVWWDEETQTYTLCNPVFNEVTKLSVIVQCETIEFGRKQFVQMNLDAERMLIKADQQ